MLHTISFVKASGAGNDFVLIDNMDRALQVDWARLATAVCSRPFGVGADGLLMLEPSETADFFMRYYNADGSYGGMCGNGGRCAARYAFLNGHARSRMKFEALGHVYEAEIDNGTVRLRMKNPTRMTTGKSLTIPAGSFGYDFIDTGSPHAVVYGDRLDEMDVAGIGRQIRMHQAFAPEGTNVDFVRIGKGMIEMRTYERGVEGETLACGTGAVGSGLLSARKAGLDSPVRVRARSGEDLLVHFVRQGEGFDAVVLEGSAHMLFTGRLCYDDERAAVTMSSS